MRMRSILGPAVAVLVGVALASLRAAAPSTSAASDFALVGTSLSDVELLRPDGSTIGLDALRAGQPALIILTRASDAQSCTRFAFETKIITRRLPALPIIIVGSGPERDEFRVFFETEHLERFAVLDTSRTLLRSLGLSAEPAVLLVDADGNILMADTRRVGKASQFPIGRVLPAIAKSLQPLRP